MLKADMESKQHYNAHTCSSRTVISLWQALSKCVWWGKKKPEKFHSVTQQIFTILCFMSAVGAQKQVLMSHMGQCDSWVSIKLGHHSLLCDSMGYQRILKWV